MSTWVMLGGVLVFVVIMPMVGSWFTSRRRLRDESRWAIEGRETTAIAALREGEPAKIRGVVAAREPLLTSPIGGQACIGYRASIDEPHDTWAAQVLSREAWPSFLVTDETGTVAVQGQLEMLVDPSDGGMDLPPSAYALLKEDAVRMNDLWGPRQFSFRETLLKVGERVSVVGRPSRAIDGAGRGSSRDPHPTDLMRGLHDEPVVVIYDDEPVGSLSARKQPVVRRLSEAPSVHGPSRREIERRELMAIAALREGEPARIRGVAAAREPLLKSPVSGRACIGYRITIHMAAESSTVQRGALVVRREEWPSFLVVDDTGTAAAQGPFSILLDIDDGAWANLPASVYALLEEDNVPLDKDFRFQEALLEPGDRVSVFGRPSLEIHPAGRGSFRAPPRLYVFRGSDEEPVAVIDDEERIG